MLLKSAYRFVFILSFLFLKILFASAQIDTINLKEITINSSRIELQYLESGRIISIIDKSEIQNAPVQDIQDLLKYVAQIDVRQRGIDGTQSDISVRGGSFEQTLILLNGVPINDPQTGHHNMNLPVDIESVARIEILKGPGARVFGPNSFTGAINIITVNADEEILKASIATGEDAYFKGTLASSYYVQNYENYAAISYKRSDGFMHNTDFKIGNLFYQINSKQEYGETKFQAGYTNKEFGANSFYSPNFPEQYEKTKTTFVNLNFESNTKIIIKPNVYWRRNKDHFRLVRDQPDFYTNNHLTDVIGGNIDFEFSSVFGVSNFGVAMQNQHIFSNVLGDIIDKPISVVGEPGFFYTHEKTRTNHSAYIDHFYKVGKLSINGGMFSYYTKDFDFGFYPGIDFSYNIKDNIAFFASINKSLRLPSFTDMYYSGPDRQGNIDLKPEQTVAFEVGAKLIKKVIQINTSYFYRHANRLIDWAYVDSLGMYKSLNVNDINTHGLEISTVVKLNYLLPQQNLLQSVKFSYSGLNMSKYAGDYESLYVLDYLKHSISFQLNHKIYNKFGASWYVIYNNREGFYQDLTTNTKKNYKAYTLVDAQIYWKNSRIKIYINATNVFDSKYVSLAYVPMPGRWINGGIKVNLNLK